MASRPQRPRLIRIPTVPSTPPSPSTMSNSPLFTPAFATPPIPTRCSSPTIIMHGGLVSPLSGSDDDEARWDEKRQMSIEVPGIVLTEPMCEHVMPTRLPSPPPKSILLLPPTSLALPLDPSSIPVQPTRHTFSPAFAALLSGTKTGSTVGSTVRGVVLLGVLAAGAWHLWSSFDVSGAIEEMAGTF